MQKILLHEDSTCGICQEEEHKLKGRPELPMKSFNNTKLLLKTIFPKIPCKYCGHTFADRNEKVFHESNHNDVIRCWVCESIVETNQEQSKHFFNEHSCNLPCCSSIVLESHSMKRFHLIVEHIHFCKFCGEAFKEETQKLIHEKQHSKTSNLFCWLCQVSFNTFEDQCVHFIQLHCDICRDKSFLSQKFNSRRQHVIEENHEFCKFCGEVFELRKERLSHEKNRECNKTSNLKCWSCELSFFNVHDQTSHFLWFHCDICRSETFLREGFHTRKQHIIEENHEFCKFCGEVFELRKERLSHEKNRECNKTSNLKCWSCELSFFNVHDQTSHFLWFHCDICRSETFLREGFHTRKQHIIEENHEFCKFCGEVFESIGERIEHQTIIHSFFPLFHCDICWSKAFSSEGFNTRRQHIIGPIIYESI